MISTHSCLRYLIICLFFIIIMELFQNLRSILSSPSDRSKSKAPKPTLKKVHVIFILPNIYEHVSGVSNKYIAFIKYLCENHRNSVNITYCNPSSVDPPGDYLINSVHVTGFPLPLYPAIKIPYITYDGLRKIVREGRSGKDSDNTIIIFNSEFFWLYPALIRLKKEMGTGMGADSRGSITLIPNMHTDIDFYLKHYLGKAPIPVPIPVRLEDLIKPHFDNGSFNKFLVTGDLLYQKYGQECGLLQENRILNVNEIDTQKFTGAYRSLRLRRGSGETLNVIYCGRIGIEKNILHNFVLCDYLLKFYMGNDPGKIRIHLIGKGPYLDELKKEVRGRYPILNSVTHYYGGMDHSQLCSFYGSVRNPIFLFSSMSETFGKTSAEAVAAGIPLFHIHSPTADLLYRDSYNAFLFYSPAEFVQKYDTYVKMNGRQLEGLDRHMREFAQKYDQQRIFEEWYRFLVNFDS